MNHIVATRTEGNNIAPFVLPAVGSFIEPMSMGTQLGKAAKLAWRASHFSTKATADMLSIASGFLVRLLVVIHAKASSDSETRTSAKGTQLMPECQLFEVTVPTAFSRGWLTAISAWVHPMLALRIAAIRAETSYDPRWMVKGFAAASATQALGRAACFIASSASLSVSVLHRLSTLRTWSGERHKNLLRLYLSNTIIPQAVAFA